MQDTRNKTESTVQLLETRLKTLGETVAQTSERTASFEEKLSQVSELTVQRAVRD